MAKKVTFNDKVDLQIWASIPNTNKIIAQDMNEIKDSINENADELINRDSETEELKQDLEQDVLIQKLQGIQLSHFITD